MAAGLRRAAVGLAVIVIGLPVARSSTFGHDPPVFVVGVEEVFYLPHYDGSNGGYQGFARDLLDQFAMDCGCVFEYRPMPIDRLFHALLEGEIDLKYPDDLYWQSDEKANHEVHYSDPISAYTDGVSVPTVVSGALTDLRLGTVPGFTARGYSGLVARGDITLEYNPHVTALLQQVLIGRLDGAYANVDVVQFILREELGAPGALHFQPLLPHTRSFYRVSSTRHPALIQELNGWLADNARWLDALRLRHGLPGES